MDSGDISFLHIKTIRQACSCNMAAVRAAARGLEIEHTVNATFFGAVAWLLVQLSLAHQSDRLPNRIVELMAELELIQEETARSHAGRPH